MYTKKAAIGEQVYRYLEHSIEMLDCQVRVLRDPVWLKKQSAADLAIRKCQNSVLVNYRIELSTIPV